MNSTSDDFPRFPRLFDRGKVALFTENGRSGARRTAHPQEQAVFRLRPQQERPRSLYFDRPLNTKRCARFPSDSPV